MDVIARAVIPLFLSHGIRDDTQIIVHLMGTGVPREFSWMEVTLGE